MGIEDYPMQMKRQEKELQVKVENLLMIKEDYKQQIKKQEKELQVKVEKHLIVVVERTNNIKKKNFFQVDKFPLFFFDRYTITYFYSLILLVGEFKL